MKSENSILLYNISEKLEDIKSYKPFQIIFYGSRERGDFTDISDYNFYLLASPSDQLRSEFIQSITRSLNMLEAISTVTLISSDSDSFKTRIKLFDPGAIQIADSGKIFYGTGGDFENIQKDWKNQKSTMSPDIQKLNYFLDGRLKFFKKLTTKNPKDEVSRLERVIALHIQLWCLEKIHDISIEELISLDIPGRILPLIENLYVNELDEDIRNLLNLYTQIHSLKRIVRYTLPQTGVNIKGLKRLSRVLQETPIE